MVFIAPLLSENENDITPGHRLL